MEKESEVAQPCLTLCNPTDCNPPSSSIHGISQARVLEWIAISFSTGSSQPRDRTLASRQILYHCTTYTQQIFVELTRALNFVWLVNLPL